MSNDNTSIESDKERHDRIVAEAVASAMAKTKAGVGKTIRTGVLSLVIGIFIIIGGLVALETEIAVYLLISGALLIIFGICMFSIASSNKKLVTDNESGKDVAAQHEARAERITARLSGTAIKEKTKASSPKQIAGVSMFLIGFFLIFAAFVLFLEEEFGAYLLGGGALLLIIGIILISMALSEKKKS